MRLINTATLEIKDFVSDTDRPPYAILSHRWGENEVTYQDWIYITKQFPRRWGWVYVEDEVKQIKSGAGFKKIENACRLASKDGLEWIWADTCCIDKTNMAELSEAINSMYRWYEQSKVCYAFLQDVVLNEEETPEIERLLGGSEWFKRGWTLQELIAPDEVIFVSQQWQTIAKKDEIANLIEKITGIPAEVVERNHFASSQPRPYASDVFSWAARRTTTRTEDRAYCLLGLLGINMPLLYGEGDAAFQRLQLEVARTLRDASYVAWGFDTGIYDMQNSSRSQCRVITDFKSTSALAGTLDQFYHSGGKWKASTTTLLEVTNIGLSVECTMIRTINGTFWFAIPCDTDIWIPIIRAKEQPKNGNELWQRLSFPTMTVDNWPMKEFLQLYKMQEKRITLDFRTMHDSLKLPAACPSNNSPYHILLTFPRGMGEYRFKYAYPADQHLLSSSSIISLSTFQEDAPGSGKVAFAVVIFLSRSQSRLVVIFAVSLVHDDEPRRRIWLYKVFEESKHFFIRWHDSINKGLESHILALAAELDAKSLAPAPPPGRPPPASRKYNSTAINVSLHEQMYPLPIKREVFHGTNVAKEIHAKHGDRYIVAQIVFPQER